MSNVWGYPLVLKVAGHEVPVNVNDNGVVDLRELSDRIPWYTRPPAPDAKQQRTTRPRVQTTASFEIVGVDRADLEGQARELANHFADGAQIEDLDVDASPVQNNGHHKTGFQANVYVRLA